MLNELIDRDELPPIVQFERRAVEDKLASVQQGRYVGKDVDYVLVTPPYSKDCVEKKVGQWFQSMEQNVANGRTNPKWLQAWKEMYQAFCNGQEIPLQGTPIKGWGVVSPAQEKTLISINCLTVEYLAGMNDEGMRRLGMGAHELRDKARHWLASMNDHGAVTVKMASLEQENRMLKASLDTLTKQVNSLSSMIPRGQREEYVDIHVDELSAASLLADDEQVSTKAVPRRSPGRPRREVQAGA